ncbi:MAG: CRISPR system precrRNA processing endoribonuclease RAMP protein Cas6 [Candidatus Viridilinea halotolerans]|uniref:CRISPR system precrRNA processing endoribonuclease RAMP protein Cas6 n=1 Tax=Candidatus Viridilinea halotolerans TaxID=2491704 RepID=A0A426TYB3_9CHLR|nr:MAG: CRISPR system precrRNA processing endoribonuclease RAMP protein Cas6 [Candidatus Viridilinea halotolerans]
MLQAHVSSLVFPPLTLLSARVRLRLLEAVHLPIFIGALLRGGFGYAFQRASCPSACWGRAEQCAATLLCPYRWVFETPHPEGVTHLHDLRDVPRPFVLEPPPPTQRFYAADTPLDFGLVLMGRGIDFLPYFLHGLAGFAAAGLGRDRTRARLEHVAVVPAFAADGQLPRRSLPPDGAMIYEDGRVLNCADLPLLNLAELPNRAAALAADLRLELLTPLRLKAQGALLDRLDLGVLVQAACWRLNALATFHGHGPWTADYRPVVEAARRVRVEQSDLRWVDWERTSTRGGGQRSMKLGGLVGSVTLRGVPVEVRAALLAAALLHVGKACVFGHGWLHLAHL